jgi:hypothetical protein
MKGRLLTTDSSDPGDFTGNMRRIRQAERVVAGSIIELANSGLGLFKEIIMGKPEMTIEFEERHALHNDLAHLAERYVAHYLGVELDGLAALGEDLLRLADCTEGRTSWLTLLVRLQKLSG